MTEETEREKIIKILGLMCAADNYQDHDEARAQMENCDLNTMLALILDEEFYLEDRGVLASVLLEIVGNNKAKNIENRALEILQHPKRFIRLGAAVGLIYAERNDLLKVAIEEEEDPIIRREIEDALREC